MAYAHKVTHQLAAPGGEVCYLRLPCFLHETRSWTVVERPRGTLWQLKIEIVSTAAQPFEKLQNSCNRRRTMMLIQHHRKRRGYVQRQLKVRAMVYGGTLILLCRSFIVPYTLSNNYIVRAYLKIKKPIWRTNTLERPVLHHTAKFCGGQSYCCGNIAIFRVFSKM